MEFIIWRTPPCRRSKLDEFIDVDCGCVALLLTPLSKIVGIAFDDWPIAVSFVAKLIAEPKIFDSFWFVADEDNDVVALFDPRRFRNDNDFRRFNFVDESRVCDDDDDCGTGDDVCFCRSNNDDTNLSSVLRSAFILECLIVFGDTALFMAFVVVFAFDEIPKRCVICNDKNGWKLIKFLCFLYCFVNAFEFTFCCCSWYVRWHCLFY